eukprot:scaffold100024_cov35-Attheya_sp.AAC.1
MSSSSVNDACAASDSGTADCEGVSQNESSFGGLSVLCRDTVSRIAADRVACLVCRLGTS